MIYSADTPVDMNHIVGNKHIVFITLDSLRYDVAQQAWEEGLTPNMAGFLPDSGWEKCHSPGNFTFPAHQAFFAGFLPSPAQPGKHRRLFMSRFVREEQIPETTYLFDEPNIVTGLANKGYYTICVGGVGFFNKLTSLGSVFPELFHESHWQESFGVTDPDSARHQLQHAAERFAANKEQPVFLFVNISAIHQPNYFYMPNPDHKARQDTVESQKAALAYVDRQLPILFDMLAQRNDVFCILCSDHGEAYGEDGFNGHCISHEVVLTVPYTHFQLA